MLRMSGARIEPEAVMAINELQKREKATGLERERKPKGLLVRDLPPQQMEERVRCKEWSCMVPPRKLF